MAHIGQPGHEIRHIPKLNGKNWSSWRYAVSLLLEKNQMLPIVMGEVLRPQQVSIGFIYKIVKQNQHIL